MAEKGARAKLEPIARQLYIDQGKSLEEISGFLDVSRQTLSKWKGETRSPGADQDEWDLARGRKKSRGERLKAMLDEMLDEMELLHATKRGPMMDALSKLGALVQRWEESEAAARERSAAHKAGLFLEFVRDLISYGGKHDQGLVAVLEENFDDIIIWGRQKYGA